MFTIISVFVGEVVISLLSVRRIHATIMVLVSVLKLNFKIFGIIPISEENLPVKLKKYNSVINQVHVAFVFIHLACLNVSVIYFLFFEPEKTFMEENESKIFFLWFILCIVIYMILIWKRSQLFALTTEFEILIEKSMFNAFENLNFL